MKDREVDHRKASRQPLAVGKGFVAKQAKGAAERLLGPGPSMVALGLPRAAEPFGPRLYGARALPSLAVSRAGRSPAILSLGTPRL